MSSRRSTISMQTAMKFVKWQMSSGKSWPLTPNSSVTVTEAKSNVMKAIDSFLEENIDIAHKAICNEAFTKIQCTDVILVYGDSILIRNILQHAFKQQQPTTKTTAKSLASAKKSSSESGDTEKNINNLDRDKKKQLENAYFTSTSFHVVVIDSDATGFSGRNLLKFLLTQGIQCSYAHIDAISYIMSASVTVPMASFSLLNITRKNNTAVPNINSIDGRSNFDMPTNNVTKILLSAEGLLANGSVLATSGSCQIALLAKNMNLPVLVCCETYKFSESLFTDPLNDNELRTSCEFKNLADEKMILPSNNNYSLKYDITPPQLISVVITEIGLIPCSSVPVVLRVKHSWTEY